MENNNQDIKLCPACGAKNKAAYKYCNECGAALNQSNYNTSGAGNPPPVYNNNSQQNYNNGNNYAPPYGADSSYYNGQYNGQFGQGSYTPYPPYGVNMNAPYYGTPDFDGVSAKDVYDYTGKAKLFNKLRIQHFGAASGPYCWPLFILGLLLGFFGMGCWYVYHKMYKPAMAFFAATIADLALRVFLVVVAINSVLELLASGELNDIINSSDYTSAQIEEFFINGMSGMGRLSLLSMAANLISLAGFVLAIVLPFFAYKQYKNHILKKIRAEYSKTPMPDIAAIGGSNVGFTVTAVVTYAIAYIVMIFVMFGSMFQAIDKFAQDFEMPDGYYEDYYDELPYGTEEFEYNDGSGDIW